MKRDPSGWNTRLTEEMISKYRASGDWSDRTIADRLDELCDIRSDQKLVVETGKTHTARELRQDAIKLAGVLTRRGLKAGDVVSVQLPNWYEQVVIEVACAYGGFVFNPIVHIYRGAEVGFIIKDSGCRLFFIPEQFRNFNFLEMANGLRNGWPKLDEIVVVRPQSKGIRSFQDLMNEEAASLDNRPDPNHINLLLYTSGTTGRAKGVLHTHNTIAAEIRNFINWLKLTRDDVILMPSPLGHITGYLYGIHLPITLGCPAVLMESWNVAEAADIIEQNGVTFTIGATPFLQELANFSKEHGRPLPSLRYFPTGGAPVPPEVVFVADQAFAKGVAFRVYGSSEAPTVTLGVTARSEKSLRANTEGFIVGHEVRLVGPDGQDVAFGEEGEIVTRGPELFVGYGLAEQNAESFDEQGFFRTGDLAIQPAKGCLTITGRKKDIIIRGGENLSPKEIEDVLYGHPAIREAAIVAMPHPRLGETCCAFVTLKPGAVFDFDTMRTTLAASGLAKQKFPERLEIVDSLPYTAAGKIRKNLLRDQIAEKLRKEALGNVDAN